MIIEFTSNSKCKNKETGEIVTITTISNGTDGRFIVFVGSDGKERRMEDVKFVEAYDQCPLLDFTSFLPNLIEAAKVDRFVYESLVACARRLHPGGYFHTGDRVFLNHPAMHAPRGDRDLLYGSAVERPMVISDITPCKSYLGAFDITVSALSDHKQTPMHTFVAYGDKITPGDAYHELQRYDTEY